MVRAGYRLHCWPHHLPLQRPGKTGRRRNGRGLQSPGLAPRPKRCTEIPSRRYFPRHSGDRVAQARSVRRGTEIEVRRVIEAEELGAEATPEIKEREQRLREELQRKAAKA